MEDFLNSVRLDKTALLVAALKDDPGDRAFWAAKTPLERLAAMEYLRVMNYAYDPVADRLQRVLTVTEFGSTFLKTSRYASNCSSSLGRDVLLR